ncbi:hypothetical protein Ancab_014337 [Ancistrocladus abbreviatus]
MILIGFQDCVSATLRRIFIPSSLLQTCVEHPQLTVDSERHLSEALLTWVSANTKQMSGHECDCTDILKQIRFCLLPLWFAMGKLKCCHFSGLIDQSIDAILALSSKTLSKEFLSIAGDGNLTHLRIRFTEYTKKLDLSGCSQIHPAILVLSLLPTSYSVDHTLRERVLRPTFMNHPYLTLDSLNISPALSLALTFESVWEIDISRCHNLHLVATLEHFSKSFPSLKVLKAAYRRDKDALKILMRMCSSVCEVDLTVDASPIIPSQVSVTQSSWNLRREPIRYWDAKSVYFSKITKLILEGRTDICGSGVPSLRLEMISDDTVIMLMETLRSLRALELCYCTGDISPLSLTISMPNLRRLKLERVTPWMTNDDLALLTENCANLTELSLIGCVHLDEDAQQIISYGWPGLISLHLEECGEITANGVGALFDCLALEDLLLRHTGRGLQLDFITDAASKLPMLRKISVDCCDATEYRFRRPSLLHGPSLRIVKIARCDKQHHGLALQKTTAQRRRVHRDTLVILFDGDSSPLGTNGVVGFGVVLRDSCGDVLMCGCKLVRIACDSTMAEAFALQFGIASSATSRLPLNPS